MLVRSFPATVIPALWIQFFVDRRGEIAIEFRIRDKAQPIKDAWSALAIFNITNPNQPTTLTVPPVAIEINDQGSLLFEVREKGGRWKKVREMPIRQRPDPE
jgi:hypothetical protein